MITSKDVFAKRRENIDEAYQMALHLVNAQEVGEWDYKAFAWCLIDLIKRDANSPNQQYVQHYIKQLTSITVSPDDDVLTKQRDYALSLGNPQAGIIRQAKSLSKEGRYQEAVNLYKNIMRNGDISAEVQTSLAWDLYRLSKEQLSNANNIHAAKRNISDYMGLDVEKPSLLHTCILQIAAKLAGDGFSLATFVRFWNLDHLRIEDFQRQNTNDGTTYPALAEKVIQSACKQAVKSNDQLSLEYLLPYLDKAIQKYPDNIWLTFYKAKSLLSLNRQNEALSFAITITKAKANEFWVWELLADICLPDHPDTAFSCYCKALTCSSDINFTAKVKYKLAEQMISTQMYAEAKLEVQQVTDYKQKAGQAIPDYFQSIIQQSWYESITSAQTNQQLYQDHCTKAEELLYSQLPWIHAILGEQFIVPGKENKPKRKLYLKLVSEPYPLEVNIPDAKFRLNTLRPGAALQVKGELDHNNQFKIFTIKTRDSGTEWDIFTESVAVVDHKNDAKKLLHFIISRNIDGVLSLSDIPYSISVGDVITVKLSKYSTKQGDRYRVISAAKTDRKPDQSVYKEFSEKVRVSGAMGFTDSDIFIPPPLMTKHQIMDDTIVSGVAVLCYNQKRNQWGWKAITIAEKGTEEFYSADSGQPNFEESSDIMDICF